MVNWKIMNADSIIALIRACNPWNKGAVAKINNQVIRLLDAVKLPGNSTMNKEPACVLAIEENGITVSTIQDEAILIRIIYAEEGFLSGNYLSRLGVTPGNHFELI